MTSDDGFALADSNTNDRTTDALNNSFNSISEMVDEYTNYSTPQDWTIFNYSGPVSLGTPIDVGFDTEGQINVWGTDISTTSYKLMGVLSGTKFTPSTSSINCMISQIVRLKQ